MKKRFLRNQVFKAMIITVSIIAVCYGFIIFSLETKRRNTLMSKIDQYMDAVVNSRKDLLANEVYLNHRSAIGLIVEKIIENKEIVDISIFDARGSVFYAMNHETPSRFSSEQKSVFQESWKKIRVRTYTYPLIVIEEPAGFIQLRYNIENALKEARTGFILFITLVLTILFFLFILLHIALSRFVIKPIEDIAGTMIRMGNGKLGEQVVVTHHNEIGEMAQTFNRMSKENFRMHNDLREANQELQSIRNYLYNIINSMPSILIGVDTNTKVTQWNTTAEKATGITASEARGKSLQDVFPQMTPRIQKISESIETRKPLTERKQNYLIKGQSEYEDLTIYPLISNGVQGAVIRVDDVTEKVRMEEMMIQSEKMLSVGGLAAGMAHEINNPLAGMIQTANVMKNRLTDLKIPANLRAAEEIGVSLDLISAYMEKRGIPNMIETINESGRRVVHIINNMLSFARKSEAVTSSHDPAALMDQIIEIAATDYDLKKQYDFKSIKIIKEYEAHLPMVPCEGSKIQQVLLNILRNGAQAMQEDPAKNENGKTPCFILRLSCEAQTHMLRIEIQDNGPGMEESIRKRVFEPFFTTKPPGVGTGLGLSVSYFIVTENHGGTMDVISSPGKGTTFIIRLPLNTGE